MGMIWDNLLAIYGFHMFLIIWDITHHINVHFADISWKCIKCVCSVNLELPSFFQQASSFSAIGKQLLFISVPEGQTEF